MPQARLLRLLHLLPLFLLGPAALTAISERPGDSFNFVLEETLLVEQTARPGAFRVGDGARVWTGGGFESTGEPGDWSAFEPAARYLLTDLTEATGSVEEGAFPAAVGWAAATVHDGALVVAGGVRADGFSRAAERWTPQADGGWSVETLAELPRPLALAGAAVMGGRLYVAGGWSPEEGANGSLFSIELGKADAAWEAEPLPEEVAWLQPAMIVRRDEKVLRDALFIFGGWTGGPGTGEAWTPLAVNWKYHAPGSPSPTWTQLEPVPAEAWLFSSAPLGPSHWVSLAVSPAALEGSPALAAPGTVASPRFLRYHVFTDTWANFASHAEHPASFVGFIGKDRIVLGTAGDAGERLQAATVTSVKRRFVFLDYAIMAVYLGGLVWIGAYFSRKEKGTEDFFLGGRKVPWWAAGLSIYATGTSAISFMAIPAKTYATDWLYFIGMSIFPFFTVTIAAFVFIPLLRELNLTTVMEYFEMRFGRSVRLLMSSITVLGQVAGRMSITLLLPSIALTAVTGMDIYTCILVMGLMATIYTVLGGINAVIWTDVVQVFVLFGGALLSIVLVLMHVDGGVVTVGSLALEDNKLDLTNWSWDFTTATMWVMFIWAISDVFGKGLGQEGLQRAFSTKGVKEARRSMITCAVVALPAGFLFYGIGTALYAFYHQFPEYLDPTLQTDAIFPLFIAQQLPAGIAGLVISALFAASMSTLDTAMNTSATIVTRDFYSIWRKGSHDREQLILAKTVTVFCGVFGTGVALYMASFENLGSLWDLFGILLGVIGGGLGGVGFLALCTTRANTAGTLTGAAVTAVSMIVIQRYTPVHFFTYGTVSLVIGSSTGYLFSLLYGLFPRWRQQKDLTGLTLWTRRKV